MNCYFCQKNIKEINFKETVILRKFITGLGKIRAKKRTGVCASHQRKLSRSIKQARHLGLLSATEK
ncbi:MAG: 30S ribosomal protein S18 [Candidatus Nealsonbacteria bacterium RIFCSPLOWO2_12_FULL_39_31]|uniref:30S ribosomal protein S18 n=3 Tax=Candidatus Nealsoniibacteriota TaxID=1817911 RepID=A0A1G2EJI4_9BACT|nr:MAG: 30S ribosomal protein S18 [Candidatus Nealsonbacteria bacterium RIFCSPHIGHO2_01_FULL_38_55]OGZ21154.1 MAG: 30S ribosomal protein S18 [Candidatus Nealsonbacteria bacterium RIFCSPHIGHO2_02_38_10]OGZ22255.1 MAG: 30S ribosomal protein S18 [Candidatus Nealsonbacteria bacterium RIFCSPHIGHO2_02_FULL_38_75]OGZ22590.1 MAG: 30S ribosomal protein S18 [Candidatus Nealsonbacteria bacterium RIFCSPHIGHO2_12_FULL_38_18]OGZ23691.1 MAG: 30S ribosomal protein S18 [Candidatus Nealsonbacteria bacterium RIFC